MTVRELLERIDSRELAEWVAFYSIEPFGGYRDDLQAGIVASTIANCNRSSRSSRSFSPKDFMPIGDHTKPRQMDEEDMFEAMKEIAEQQDAKDE